MTRLSQVVQTLRTAYDQPDLAERFELLYQAALHATGALIAARPVRQSRPRQLSAWVILDRNYPEFAQFAAYFTQHSRTRADSLAGLPGRITESLVADFARQVELYVDAVHHAVHAENTTQTAA
jgi:hypothetical protein